MRSMLRVLASASLLVVASACQKAEFEKVSPEALIMSLSTGVVSADDASLTVSVQAVDDGVAVLEEDILFTIGGTCVAAPQTVPTDPSSGLAIATFAGLDAAGACTVTAATLGDVTATADFQVVAGAPATLTFVSVGQTDITAGEEVTFSVEILDAALNPIALAADVTTDSPGAIFSATGISYEEAGTFSILASLDNFPALSDSIDVTVDTATAAQVTAAVLQTSVGQQQELLVTCTELDAFGNVRTDPFDATEVTTVPAADTITEDGTVDGLFHISGFPTFGVYVVTCDSGALSDDKTFTVIQQGGANSVVASANLTLVEAGTGTLTVTCTEVDQFGNDVGTQFDLPTGFVTTASGVVLAEPSPNVFTATGITAKGVFVATCDNGTDSDSELYTVGDSTAPTEDAFTFNGTAPFAVGTTVTVNLDVQDVIGVASQSLVLVSGPGVITSPATILETTANPPARTFQVRVDGTVGSSSTVVVRGQAADTTGNLAATANSLSITVNAAPTITTAAVSPSTVEAGSTLTVTCTEKHAVTASNASTAWAAGDVTTTAVGESIGAPTGNQFAVTDLLTKGTFTATCAGDFDSGDTTFTVADTTPPTETAFSVTGGTGPYAAGTTVTVNLDVLDLVGVASESLVVVSGPGVITSPSTILEGGTANPPSRSFQVRLDGTVGAASQVVVRGQAADTTGNLLATASSLTIDVNAGTTSVVTTLAGSSIEHNQTLDFSCKQVNAANGQDTGAAFALGNVSTTAPGGVISSLGSNAFRITGPFTSKGSFTATCTLSAQSDIETFSIFDATAPTIGTLSVVSGTPDDAYAPGQTVTVRLSSAADGIGLARAELSLTGSASVNQPNPRFLTGTSATNVDFTITVDAAAATFSSIVLTAQATDTTGNTVTSATKTLTVDPAVGMAVASGITMRTLFESVGTPMPTGIGTDGTDLFLQRHDGAFDIEDVVRITGTTGPASLSTVITAGFPASTATGGITALPSGSPFGTKTLFHTLGPATAQIGVENGATHANFDPTPSNFVDPRDVTFGDLGSGSRIWSVDSGTAFPTVFQSIVTGEVAPFFIGSAGELAGCVAIVMDPTNFRLLLPDADGSIDVLEDDGGGNPIFSTLIAPGTLPVSEATDIAVGNGKILVSGGNLTGTVYRVNGVAVQAAISSEFDDPMGLAVKSADGDSLHVLDIGALVGGYRIYKVTGY